MYNIHGIDHLNSIILNKILVVHKILAIEVFNPKYFFNINNTSTKKHMNDILEKYFKRSNFCLFV